MRLKLGCAAALATFAYVSSASADALDRANAIAQKFSEASDPKPATAPVTQTPAKPAAHPDRPPVKKTAAPAMAPKPAAPAPIKAAESAPSRPDLDYEMDMLRRARLEEAERKTAGQKTAAPPLDKPAIIPVDAKAEQRAPVPPAAEAQPATPPPKAAPPASVPAPAAAPAASPAPPPVAKVLETAPPTAAPSVTSAAPQAGPRATILLALDTTPAGGARAKVVPDPIICIDQVCYVSGGFTKAAIGMTRGDALALKGTEGKSQETCRGQFGCIYRDVAIPTDATISVVDLGTGSSSDAGSFSIAADASCKIDEGELVCSNGLVTHAYRVWTVPELTAKSVGAQVLEDAIADGLVGDDIASTNDK